LSFVSKNLLLIVLFFGGFLFILGFSSYGEKNKRIKYDFYQLEIGAQKVSINQEKLWRRVN